MLKIKNKRHYKAVVWVFLSCIFLTACGADFSGNENRVTSTFAETKSSQESASAKMEEVPESAQNNKEEPSEDELKGCVAQVLSDQLSSGYLINQFGKTSMEKINPDIDPGSCKLMINSCDGDSSQGWTAKGTLGLRDEFGNIVNVWDDESGDYSLNFIVHVYANGNDLNGFCEYLHYWDH